MQNRFTTKVDGSIKSDSAVWGIWDNKWQRWWNEKRFDDVMLAQQFCQLLSKNHHW